ncbi:peroxiredoxin [Haloferula luteola]|uniref:Peroxiredoxin n=1 Tax=Haloferula luteola TaxID=595692 RepID=A0A840V558_9BACT|nr:redoxin domain-containing protein [Haloferula luteola]MBB5353155.1 peroxiredoxin [Haloferula luteola]
MKTLAACLLLVASSLVHAAEPPLLDEHGNPAGFKTLAIGDAAPDFKLPGIDGRTWSMSDFAEFELLMVLFTSNHCPTSHSIEQRLQKLRNDYRDRGLGLVAIMPNHPDGIRLDELGFGEFNDSFEDMKPYAELNGWDFPYLYDGETQSTARAYGCLCTPHVFIFDRQRHLQYAGRFDDSRFFEESTVRSPDARQAIEDLLAGRPVTVPLTRPHGCSTKWREKKAEKIAIADAWKKLPVTLDPIDAEGVAALRANPTDKYRLVNVWATWCAPCVEEFPTLVDISRQYDMRPFELITVSMDSPQQHEAAHRFLQKQGAGLTRNVEASVKKEGRTTNHYRFTGAQQDELVAALDPEWPGPLPHTVLIAPGGEILWRHNGVIQGAEARTQIATALTRYYSPAE